MDAISAFLKEKKVSDHFELLKERNRVKCTLTDHELMADLEAVQTYVTQNKKYKKMKDWYSYDFSVFFPAIVPNRRNDKKLFCTVTKQTLNRIPEEVERHVKGKKFQRLSKSFQESKPSRDDENEDSEDSKEFDGNRFEFEFADVIYSDSEDDGNNNDKDDIVDFVDNESEQGNTDSELTEKKEDVDNEDFETVPIRKSAPELHPDLDDDDDEVFVDAPEEVVVPKKKRRRH